MPLSWRQLPRRVTGQAWQKTLRRVFRGIAATDPTLAELVVVGVVVAVVAVVVIVAFGGGGGGGGMTCSALLSVCFSGSLQSLCIG